MHYILYALDKPDHTDVRAANREAHLAWAGANRETMVMGGPFLTDDGGTMIGSLALFEAKTIEPARAFVAGDPYGKAGLFQSIEVHPWYQAVPGEQMGRGGSSEIETLWVIYGRQRADAEDDRAKVIEAHVAYVQDNLPIIHYAGPLFADDEETPIGPLFVIAAESRVDVEGFVAADPFSKIELLESVDIHRWKQTV